MISGISTACLYPMEIERALDTLCTLGFDTLELFFNSPSEISPPFVRSLRSVADQSGAKIVSVHPFSSSFEAFMFFSDYYRRFEVCWTYIVTFSRRQTFWGQIFL